MSAGHVGHWYARPNWVHNRSQGHWATYAKPGGEFGSNNAVGSTHAFDGHLFCSTVGGCWSTVQIDSTVYFLQSLVTEWEVS